MRYFNFSMTLFLCATFSFHAQAQKVATCESFKPTPTRIETQLAQEKVKDVRDYNADDLDAYFQQNFYKWKHPDAQLTWISDADVPVGGYFKAGTGVEIGFGFTIAPYEGQKDLSCVFVDYLDVYVHYSGTIFIDKTYDEVECRDLEPLINSHLNGRYDIGAGVAISTESLLRQNLPKVIKEMEHFAVKTDAAQDKVNKIKKALKAGAATYAQDMMDKVITLNNGFSVSDDLVARSQQCIKSIPRQYRP